MGSHVQPESSKKMGIFLVSRSAEAVRGSPYPEIFGNTLLGSCCLKTTLVVFVAKNCWFYQNLKKSERPLSNTNQHKNTLGVLLLKNNTFCLKKWAIFRHSLKMASDIHTRCHEYDLSNITDWQHVSRGPTTESSVEISTAHAKETLNFH